MGWDIQIISSTKWVDPLGVESKPGKGTTITMIFKQKTMASPAKNALTASASMAGEVPGLALLSIYLHKGRKMGLVFLFSKSYAANRHMRLIGLFFNYRTPAIGASFTVNQSRSNSFAVVGLEK